jgi:hypothetical protein
MIPFFSALHIPDDHLSSRYALAIGTALLGVLITILESVLQLHQFQQIWITSRATAEAMIREKYMPRAGPTAGLPIRSRFWRNASRPSAGRKIPNGPHCSNRKKPPRLARKRNGELQY